MVVVMEWVPSDDNVGKLGAYLKCAWVVVQIMPPLDGQTAECFNASYAPLD